MTFTNTEPSSHESENVWFTPKEYIEACGPFDLDPCTVSYRPFDTATLHIEHDMGGCGIENDWIGEVWLNPPYGKQIMPFIDKFIEHKQGLMLIFSRMGSEGVQKIIKSGAYIYCLRRRLYFIRKDGGKATNAGTDSMLVFFNDRYIDKVKVFSGVLLKGIESINQEAPDEQG